MDAAPVTDFEVTLTADQIACYRENGFLVVERITTDEEIDWLAAVYDHIFGGGDDVVRPVDRSGVLDPSKVGTVTQAFHPEFRIPEILDTAYVRNAKRIGSALLGVEVDELTVWTHMIKKAPGGREVPPHQDEAYWPADYDYGSVAAWLPMHDVEIEMGAMQFLPGSHLGGVVAHRHYDNPLERLLEVVEPIDADAFVPCPLRKGGCTFHDPATIHRTAVNATDRDRLAFPLTVQTTPVRRSSPRPTPWIEEYYAAGGTPQTAYVADAKVVPLPA